MKKAIASWKWSLKVVTRSYRLVVGLGALIALWVYAAYAWLGLPESSVLLLILALAWAIVQLLAGVAVLAGIVSGAAEAAASEGQSLPLGSLGTIQRSKFLNTLLLCLGSGVVIWLCSEFADWINGHSVEVASFLTFHSQKPVSHALVEEICNVGEGLLWVVLGGFLLSIFIAVQREGWHGAAKRTWKLLAACAFPTPFLTSLLSVAVFGGIAYELVNWHPLVPPGFWDYTQVIVRFGISLILISAGGLFWSLSLARLTLPNQNPPDAVGRPE